MPSILDTPVLQVDANVIHKVDTSNPQNLFSMWTVFARCADSVAQGRRLENLSWRLWTRETFCVDTAGRLSSNMSTNSLACSTAASTSSTSLKPRKVPRRAQTISEDMPQLSGSVESAADEEAVVFANESGAVDIMRPRIRRQDSCGSNRSRGRERHITSDDLEKMVASIVQEKEPLKAPLPEITPLAYPILPVTEPAEPVIERAALESAIADDDDTATASSTLSASSAYSASEPRQTASTAAVSTEPSEAADAATKSTTTVIRGFSPSYMPIAQTVSSLSRQTSVAEENAIPEPTSAPAAKSIPSKKATFALGGSSSGDDSMSDPSQSLEMRQPTMQQMIKRKSGAISAAVNASPSEAAASPKSALLSTRHSLMLGGQKKQTSFSKQLVSRTIPAAVVSEDDQSESEDIDESAIDDDEDDSSDWEDSNEDSGRSSVDDKSMFQRVDSKVHLPSRRSLITLMIQRSEREVKNGLTTSQSTMALPRARMAHQPPSMVASPNDSDDATLMMRHRSRGPQSSLRPINEIPRSSAQPILSTATSGHYQAASSPRTNRRNMLSTELTESLRRHLLWERSQKTSTANAVLKRRHTSHDVANLKQYPEVAHMNKDLDANATSWDQYLNRDAFNGYHAKGW